MQRFLLVGVSVTDWRKFFFATVSLFVTQEGVTRIGIISLEAMANVFVYVLFFVKFRVCENSPSYASETIVMADLCQSMWNLALTPIKTSISTIITPMATKLGRVVTYHEGIPPITSHYPLIT